MGRMLGEMRPIDNEDDGMHSQKYIYNIQTGLCKSSISILLFIFLCVPYNMNKRIWMRIQQNKRKPKILYPFWMMCITREITQLYYYVRLERKFNWPASDEMWHGHELSSQRPSQSLSLSRQTRKKQIYLHFRYYLFSAGLYRYI